MVDRNLPWFHVFIRIMKLIAISDLHLDASFGRDGFNPQVGRKLRYSLQQTLLNVIELVKSSNADALLCGGDMYEQDRFSPETAALMRYAFTQIDPVPVYIAPGNLDWYGPQSLYQQVDWSPNVHIFRTNQLSPVTLTEGFTLWGAAHCAPAGTQNFLSGFQVDRGGVHIGVFHGSAVGLVTGESEEKFPHAPFEAREHSHGFFDIPYLVYTSMPRSYQ